MTTTRRVRAAVRRLSLEQLRSLIKRLAKNERTTLAVEEAIVELRARTGWWKG
jgi:hypothetical protein